MPYPYTYPFVYEDYRSAVGDGSVTMAGATTWQFVQSVGGGSIAIASSIIAGLIHWLKLRPSIHQQYRMDVDIHQQYDMDVSVSA